MTSALAMSLELKTPWGVVGLPLDDRAAVSERVLSRIALNLRMAFMTQSKWLNFLVKARLTSNSFGGSTMFTQLSSAQSKGSVPLQVTQVWF